MGWFSDLFSPKKTEEPERDYSNRAVPDPHTVEGRAPFIDAWDGYADKRSGSGSPLHTIGRHPAQIPGEYPTSEGQFDREEPVYTVAPLATQSVRMRAPDPRWASTTPIRTQRAPSTYRTVNPFDWKLARHLNGLRFSMASHIRTYSVGGMKPVIQRRNTFRLLPPPHDINRTNLPASGTAVNVSEMDSRGISAGQYRSPVSRLGG